MSSEKGKFSTDISQGLIDAAMRSVDKAKAEVHGQPAPGTEVEVPVEVAPAAATPGPAAAPAAAPAPPPEPEAPPEATPEKEIESLKAMVEIATTKTRELSQKLKDEHERTLRAAADLENYKRRAQKERDEVQRFGCEKLLKDFLPVVDNFDRALEHAKAGGDMKSLQDGRGDDAQALRRHPRQARGEGLRQRGQDLRPQLPRGDAARSRRRTSAAQPRGQASWCAASPSTTGWCGRRW